MAPFSKRGGFRIREVIVGASCVDAGLAAGEGRCTLARKTLYSSKKGFLVRTPTQPSAAIGVGSSDFKGKKGKRSTGGERRGGR